MPTPQQTPPDLQKIRKELESIDAGIIDFLARRFHLTDQAMQIKSQADLPVEDLDREAELEAIYTDLALQKGLDPAALNRIFAKIRDEVKAEAKN
jgi:chorismate mutase